MNHSPEICVECEHRFPPGTPEPSWCPFCGRLCSASDEPEARAEVIEEFSVRALGMIFWIIFLGAPVVAVVAAIVPQSWLYAVPTRLGLPMIISPTDLPMAALFGGVACSGWILGRIAGRTTLERGVMMVFGAAIVAMIYLCAAKVVGTVLSFWMK